MIKMIKNKNIIYFIGILVTIVIGIFIWKQLILQDKNSSVNNTISGQTYTSNTLKFSIEIPSDYIIQDKEISINLAKGDKNINIGRTGTNYSDVEGYLEDLSVKNGISFENKASLLIDSNNAIKTTIKHPVSGDPDSMAYFIYKNYSVYRISSADPALYGDLDQIAKSFRYTP